uniref:Uncharacterized protein n=1 Tax=Lactuca sativa TaxID=4236 RepID=A0A9R1XDY0_LACSA|nr:hypothetical protein LSAT_V11C500255860 [Lactuca sativa]
MKKSKAPKASKCEDGVDLISNIPDAILLLILSHLYYRFYQDKLKKDKFKDFVYWVLASRSVDLDRFRLGCLDYYTMLTVGRWIHMAVTRNVKKLELKFLPQRGE